MSTPQQARARSNRSIGHYILGKTIGEGTFGKVKIGTHILTGERVAVKVLEKERIVEVADVERVAREVHILKLIRHPHIVQLYEIIETRRQLYLIMEYASGGELFDYIVANSRVQEPEACRFFQQIIAGVEKIHQMNIVHRDLKPENLLLDDHRGIKIVDFGLSNVFRDGQLLKTACGSPCYAAPEMIAGHSYVPSLCDLWSCGVILFALVCGYLPFEDQNTAALYKKIMAADYRPPKFISQEVKDLIAGLLTTEPNKRFTIPIVRSHPWYRQIAESSSTPRDLNKEQHNLEEDVLRELDAFGFPREYAVRCLELNKHNHVTTTYYLLVEKKRRMLDHLDRLMPDGHDSRMPTGYGGSFDAMGASQPRTPTPTQVQHHQAQQQHPAAPHASPHQQQADFSDMMGDAARVQQPHPQDVRIEDLPVPSGNVSPPLRTVASPPPPHDRHRQVSPNTNHHAQQVAYQPQHTPRAGSPQQVQQYTQRQNQPTPPPSARGGARDVMVDFARGGHHDGAAPVNSVVTGIDAGRAASRRPESPFPAARVGGYDQQRIGATPRSPAYPQAGTSVPWSPREQGHSMDSARQSIPARASPITTRPQSPAQVSAAPAAKQAPSADTPRRRSPPPASAFVGGPQPVRGSSTASGGANSSAGGSAAGHQVTVATTGGSPSTAAAAPGTTSALLEHLRSSTQPTSAEGNSVSIAAPTPPLGAPSAAPQGASSTQPGGYSRPHAIPAVGGSMTHRLLAKDSASPSQGSGAAALAKRLTPGVATGGASGSMSARAAYTARPPNTARDHGRDLTKSTESTRRRAVASPAPGAGPYNGVSVPTAVSGGGSLTAANGGANTTSIGSSPMHGGAEGPQSARARIGARPAVQATTPRTGVATSLSARGERPGSRAMSATPTAAVYRRESGNTGASSARGTGGGAVVSSGTGTTPRVAPPSSAWTAWGGCSGARTRLGVASR